MYKFFPPEDGSQEEKTVHIITQKIGRLLGVGSRWQTTGPTGLFPRSNWKEGMQAADLPMATTTAKCPGAATWPWTWQALHRKWDSVSNKRSAQWKDAWTGRFYQWFLQALLGNHQARCSRCFPRFLYTSQRGSGTSKSSTGGADPQDGHCDGAKGF